LSNNANQEQAQHPSNVGNLKTMRSKEIVSQRSVIKESSPISGGKLTGRTKNLVHKAVSLSPIRRPSFISK
jgi:hypothetical protein